MTERDNHEDREHYRGKSRPGRRVKLAYRRSDGDGGKKIQAVTRNVGIGGAFIVTAQPDPIGSRLVVSLTIPTARQPIEVLAEVRWVAEPIDGGAPDDAGMGVKFYDLDVNQLLELSEYFASITGPGAAVERS